jgi:hypothetical protein
MTMAVTMAEPQAARPVLWPFVIVILFMHFQFTKLAGFPLTIAPVFVVWFFVTHYRLALKPISWLMLVMLYLYPFVPALTGPNLPNLAGEFAKTYGLFVIHIGLLVMAFSAPIKPSATSPRDLARIAFRLLIITSVIDAAQSLVATLTGSIALYNLFGPFQYMYEQHTDTLLHYGSWIARAQGLYLEPSFAAMVAITLSVICLLARYREGTTKLILVAALIFIGSRGGQLVALVIIGLDWLLRLGHRWVVGLGIASLVLAVLSAPLLYQFASALGVLVHIDLSDFSTAGTSEYFRMVMGPIVLARTLPDYPLGLPFGSMEVIVGRITGFPLELPNNVYVLLYYFGIFGFLALLVLVALALFSLFRGNQQATRFYTLFIATLALSGSFLSPETTSLIFMLVFQYRNATERPPPTDARESPPCPAPT